MKVLQPLITTLVTTWQSHTRLKKHGWHMPTKSGTGLTRRTIPHACRSATSVIITFSLLGFGWQGLSSQMGARKIANLPGASAASVHRTLVT